PSLFALQPNALQVALKLTARLVAQQESLSSDIDNDSPRQSAATATGNGLLANGVLMGLVRHLTMTTSTDPISPVEMWPSGNRKSRQLFLDQSREETGSNRQCSVVEIVMMVVDRAAANGAGNADIDKGTRASPEHVCKVFGACNQASIPIESPRRRDQPRRRQ